MYLHLVIRHQVSSMQILLHENKQKQMLLFACKKASRIIGFHHSFVSSKFSNGIMTETGREKNVGKIGYPMATLIILNSAFGIIYKRCTLKTSTFYFFSLVAFECIRTNPLLRTHTFLIFLPPFS